MCPPEPMREEGEEGGGRREGGGRNVLLEEGTCAVGARGVK